MEHPVVVERVVEETEDVTWMKKTMGMSDDSGWIQFYKDIKNKIAEPEVEEDEEEDDKTSSLCWPDPNRDPKWKYCGYYTGLDREEHEERKGVK